MTAEQLEELQLLEETQKRNKMRESLLEWSSFCVPEQGLAPTGPALHHRVLLDNIQAAIDGKLVNSAGVPVRGLMVLMPPGSAKSTYTSICTPPWYLQRKPGCRILACSHAADLIESFSYQCRGAVEAHSTILGYSLRDDKTAVKEWFISNGGSYRCGSVGTSISGRRADLGFIDDYIGKEKDATSEGILEDIYKWYRRDFEPRLKPEAVRIIVANRRNVADLVGRLLKEEPNRWVVIRLPMIAEENDFLGRKPGERLWPEYFTEEMVEVAKAFSDWAGLYQQRPALEEGDYFKKDWLMEYGPNDLPPDLRNYIGSDHAYRTNQKNDLTCIIPGGFDHRNRLWILPDVFWGKVDSGEGVETMLQKAKHHRPLMWWLGKDAFEGVVAPFLRQRMKETGVFINTEALVEARDKEARARCIQGRMRQGMVMFPRFAPWWPQAKAQLLNFPNDEHDDFVDALANLGRGLDRMVPGDLVVTPRENFAPQRLTMGYVRQCHKLRNRRRMLATLDN